MNEWMSKNSGWKLALNCPPRSQSKQKYLDGRRKPSTLHVRHAGSTFLWILKCIYCGPSTSHTSCSFLTRSEWSQTNRRKSWQSGTAKLSVPHWLGPLRIPSISSYGCGFSSSLTHTFLLSQNFAGKNNNIFIYNTVATLSRHEGCVYKYKMK